MGASQPPYPECDGYRICCRYDSSACVGCNLASLNFACKGDRCLANRTSMMRPVVHVDSAAMSRVFPSHDKVAKGSGCCLSALELDRRRGQRAGIPSHAAR